MHSPPADVPTASGLSRAPASTGWILHLNVCLLWCSHSPEHPDLPLCWQACHFRPGQILQHAVLSLSAYGIKPTDWSTWAMTIPQLHAGINSQTTRDTAELLKAGDISLLLISGVSSCKVNDKMLQDQLLGTEHSSSSTSGRHSAQGPLTESSCANPGSNTGSSPLAAPCCLVFPLWRGNMLPYFALLLDIHHLITMKVRGLWSVANKMMKPDHPSQTL